MASVLSLHSIPSILYWRTIGELNTYLANLLLELPPPAPPSPFPTFLQVLTGSHDQSAKVGVGSEPLNRGWLAKTHPKPQLVLQPRIPSRKRRNKKGRSLEVVEASSGVYGRPVIDPTIVSLGLQLVHTNLYNRACSLRLDRSIVRDELQFGLSLGLVSKLKLVSRPPRSCPARGNL